MRDTLGLSRSTKWVRINVGSKCHDMTRDRRGRRHKEKEGKGGTNRDRRTKPRRHVHEIGHVRLAELD